MSSTPTKINNLSANVSSFAINSPTTPNDDTIAAQSNDASTSTPAPSKKGKGKGRLRDTTPQSVELNANTPTYTGTTKQIPREIVEMCAKIRAQLAKHSMKEIRKWLGQSFGKGHGNYFVTKGFIQSNPAGPSDLWKFWMDRRLFVHQDWRNLATDSANGKPWPQSLGRIRVGAVAGSVGTAYSGTKIFPDATERDVSQCDRANFLTVALIEEWEAHTGGDDVESDEAFAEKVQAEEYENADGIVDDAETNFDAGEDPSSLSHDHDRNTSAAQKDVHWTFDCSRCGLSGTDIDDGKPVVKCLGCDVWQHSQCHNIPNENAEQTGFVFICAACQDRTAEWKKSSKLRNLVAGGGEILHLENSRPKPGVMTRSCGDAGSSGSGGGGGRGVQVTSGAIGKEHEEAMVGGFGGEDEGLDEREALEMEEVDPDGFGTDEDL